MVGRIITEALQLQTVNSSREALQLFCGCPSGPCVQHVLLVKVEEVEEEAPKAQALPFRIISKGI